MDMIRRTTSLLSFLLAGLGAVPLLAQSGGAPPASSAAGAGANTVSIPFTVRDKHDKLIPNLTKDDFTLMVDGKPQAIVAVSSAAGLPLTVGLVEQTSLAQQGAVDAERMGSKSFLDVMLKGSDDKAFLIQFDREVDLLADVSANKTKLENAVNQLGSPQTQNTGATQETADEGKHRIGGSGTTLYDAIYLASNEVIAKQTGRKVLIVVTDGVDRGSKVSLFQAIEAAQRANTSVYAIYVKGEQQRGGGGGNSGHRHVGMGYPGGNPGGGYPGSGGGWPGGGRGNGPTARPTEGSRIDGRKILIQICGETGGRMFEAGKKASIEVLSTAIADELNARYMLQFAPDKQSDYGGFHRIALTANKKDYYAQARQGYYGGE